MGATRLHIDDAAHAQRLPVVPPAVVGELADELDGRLRAVALALGHVQIVDEDGEGLAEHGAPQREREAGVLVLALPALLELRVEKVLPNEGSDRRLAR